MSTPSKIPIDSDTALSEAIVVAIAEREGTSPLELPPLFEALDLGALDCLFRERPAGRISFEYAGYEVVVCGRDRLLLREQQSRSIHAYCNGESNETADSRFYCEVCGWNDGIDDATDTATGSHQAIDQFLETSPAPIPQRQTTK